MWNVLPGLPPGGEGWPRNSKNENLSAARVQIVTFHTLLRLQLPGPDIDTHRHRLSIVHSIGETPNIGRNPRNFFTSNK